MPTNGIIGLAGNITPFVSRVWPREKVIPLHQNHPRTAVVQTNGILAVPEVLAMKRTTVR